MAKVQLCQQSNLLNRGDKSKLQVLALLLELRGMNSKSQEDKATRKPLKHCLCFQVIAFIAVRLLEIPAFFRLKRFSWWDSYRCHLLILYSSCSEVLQEINLKPVLSFWRILPKTERGALIKPFAFRGLRSYWYSSTSRSCDTEQIKVLTSKGHSFAKSERVAIGRSWLHTWLKFHIKGWLENCFAAEAIPEDV